MSSTDATSADATFRLLVMCTANQCRSPMAAVIADAHLHRRGVDAAVASCGVMDGGVPATPGAARAVRRKGLDLSEHISQQLDLETVEAADLIVVMERQHLTAVAELSLRALDRSFTLGELSELAQVVGPRTRGTPVGAWIARVNAMRHPTTVLSHSTEGDVGDPMGGPGRAYRSTADELERLLVPVLDAIFPDAAPSGAAPSTTPSG